MTTTTIKRNTIVALSKDFLGMKAGHQLGQAKAVRSGKVTIEIDGDDFQIPATKLVAVKVDKKPRKGKAPMPKKPKDISGPVGLQGSDIPEFLLRTPEPPVMTKRIQIIAFGSQTKKGQMVSLTAREFLNIGEAKAFLDQYADNRDLETNDSGTFGRFDLNTTLRCNADMRAVVLLKRIPAELPVIITSAMKPARIEMPTYSTTEGDTTMTTTKKSTKKSAASNSSMVPLKKLCQEFELDPRKARQKLRKAIGNNDGRWEWPADSGELGKIKSILDPKATVETPAAKATVETPAPKKPAAKKTTKPAAKTKATVGEKSRRPGAKSRKFIPRRRVVAV